MSIEEKIEKIAKDIYGADGVNFDKLHWGRKTSRNTEKKFVRLLIFFGWDVGEEEGDLHLLTTLLNASTCHDTVYVEPGRTVTVDMLAGG
ncbi:MAG: hypothetical protein P4L59_09955 [Desulfosporosinus sp.]|nr:hypothetical protein [Desulfosporosinus sp.]